MGHSEIVNGMGDEQGRAADDGAPVIPRVPGLVLLRRLGRGGHGEVWVAAELTSGERVAVKVDRASSVGRSGGDRPAASGGDDATSRLDREIAVLRRIDHPHVVRLRRVIDLPDGGRALVTDLAAGGSLADLVAGRGSLDPSEACTVVVPLARTLAELHSRGLVHGDLAPGNILFSADGRPLIADLGCAVVLGERHNQVWGTDGYVDPARVGRADPLDDVYALGALLRFVVTGTPEAGADGALPDAARDRARALLALADRCSGPRSGRPAPDDVARAALDAAPPAPVRLLRAGPSGGRATLRPSASVQGWTRPVPAPGPVCPAGAGVRAVPSGDPSTATAATILPVTALDLGVSGGVGGVGPSGPAGGAAVPASSSGSGPVAVTRRRSPGGPAATDAARREQGPGKDSGRLPGRRAQRRRADPGQAGVAPSGVGSRRSLLLIVTAAVLVTGAAWLALGALHPSSAELSSADSPSARPPSARPLPELTAAGPSSEESQSAESSSGPGAPTEPLDVAVVRLARGRAAAFGAAALEPLASVDEPGSAALVSDSGLVSRLRARGLRLDGLAFEVSDVRRVEGDGRSVTVVATVVTSAHRQIALGDGSVRATVPASAPREVALTLVPDADGRRWLVRAVRSDAPPGGVP